MDAVLITNRKRPLDGVSLPAGLEVVPAGSGSQALLAAREAVASGARRVVVAGGDGSVHAVLPALAGKEAMLGLVPRGTGNDLARSLGLPRGDPERALEVALEAPPRALDLMEIEATGDTDLTAVGVAAGAAVRVQGRLDAWRRTSPRLTRGLGRAGFVATALAEAFRPSCIEARVEWEDGCWEGRLLGFLVYLCRYFGGGFPSPGPGADGERADVVVLEDPGSLAGRLAAVAAVRSGRWNRRGVILIRAARVSLQAVGPVALTLDGEYRRRRDPTFRLARGALRIAAPGVSWTGRERSLS